MVYAALFATGELLFGRMMQAAGLYAVAVITAAILYRRISRMVEAPATPASDGATG
jgi:hypothetical protein